MLQGRIRPTKNAIRGPVIDSLCDGNAVPEELQHNGNPGDEAVNAASAEPAPYATRLRVILLLSIASWALVAFVVVRLLD